MTCLLCENSTLQSVKHVARPGFRYFHCAECDLIFLNPAQRLNESFEKSRYLLHDNSETEEGYIAFLEKFLLEVDKLQPQSILDFGSGPKPVMAELMRKRGWEVGIYDYYFASDEKVFRRTYDLITMHEVLEHLKNPLQSLQMLVKLLNPDGHIFVRTELHQGTLDFSSWWYAKDPTHVCFFSEKTFEFLNSQLENKILFFKKD